MNMMSHAYSGLYNKTHHKTQDMKTGKENGQSAETRVEKNMITLHCHSLKVLMVVFVLSK